MNYIFRYPSTVYTGASKAIFTAGVHFCVAPVNGGRHKLLDRRQHDSDGLLSIYIYVVLAPFAMFKHITGVSLITCRDEITMALT